MAVKPIPDGYHTITPYLIVDGAAQAIEFYKDAFGAEELMRLDMPDGKVGHAEIRIGDSPVMLADENLERDARGPNAYGGSPASLLIYVEDVDTVFHRALELGATMLMPLCDQWYGDRSGTLADPFGHTWSIASRIEDLSEEEINKRFSEMFE